MEAVSQELGVCCWSAHARHPPQYIFFYQLPWLPELALRNNDLGAMDLVFKGVLSKEEIGYFKHAMSRPGAATAAINYYRGLPLALAGGKKSSKVTVPTLVIWAWHGPDVTGGVTAAG